MTRPNVLDEVAVFWDFENCRPSCNISGNRIVDRIRSLIQYLGSITTFRAYLDISLECTYSRSSALHCDLQSSGVTLVHCPHNGKKDVADKMMIVDMLAFAIGRPPPASVVIITGDRDFAYAAGILRLRGYHVIVIASPSTAHGSLKMQASQLYDWQKDILEVSDPEVDTSSLMPLKSIGSPAFASDQPSETLRLVAAATQNGSTGFGPRDSLNPASHRVVHSRSNSLDKMIQTPSFHSLQPSEPLSMEFSDHSRAESISEPCSSNLLPAEAKLAKPSNSEETPIAEGSNRAQLAATKSPSTGLSKPSPVPTASPLGIRTHASTPKSEISLVDEFASSSDDAIFSDASSSISATPYLEIESASGSDGSPFPTDRTERVRSRRASLTARLSSLAQNSVVKSEPSQVDLDILSDNSGPTAVTTPTTPSPTMAARERFRTLITFFLERKASKRSTAVLSAELGAKLRECDPRVYEKVGVTKLKAYIEEARKAGVVITPGLDAFGTAWVEINPVLYLEEDGMQVTKATVVSTDPPKGPVISARLDPRPDVDAAYLPLINRLRSADHPHRLLYSTLGMFFSQYHPDLYKRASVLGLSAYLQKAEELGIVRIGRGTSPGTEWVELSPAYHGAVN